jgi:uncharacterized protein YmfQ (DUF2313 family)
VDEIFQSPTGITGPRASFVAEPERDRHVRRNGLDYLYAFFRLFPLGIAWPRKPDTAFGKTCRGLANVWGFVDGRAADLLEIETDPRRTTDVPSYLKDPSKPDWYSGLLDEWERAYGLPDPCFPATYSEEDRRRMLVFKVTLLGGQSRAFFEWVSAWVGYNIQIAEYAPYMTGVSEVGDTVGEYDDTGNYRWYLGAAEIRFYWSIRADQAVLQWFRAGEGGGEVGVDHHLEIFLESPIECLLRRWKPAHTELVFDYQASLNEADINIS